MKAQVLVDFIIKCMILGEPVTNEPKVQDNELYWILDVDRASN